MRILENYIFKDKNYKKKQKLTSSSPANGNVALYGRINLFLY